VRGRTARRINPCDRIRSERDGLTEENAVKKRLAALLAVLLAPIPAALAQSEPNRSIALILDASGSMKAALPGGQARIDAAKDAIAKLVSGLPDGTRLALRAYGHQSPTKAKNCRDTELLTGFTPVGANRAEVISRARGLAAQGYSPRRTSRPRPPAPPGW
jgi:hypothetical protein